ELPVAGLDVVEVAPPYDHAQVTAFLANRVVLEALSGIAWRRGRSAAGGDSAGRMPPAPLLAGRGARPGAGRGTRPPRGPELIGPSDPPICAPLPLRPSRCRSRDSEPCTCRRTGTCRDRLAERRSRGRAWRCSASS